MKHYFLFGSTATDIYEQEGINGLLSKLKNKNGSWIFSTHVHDSKKDTPASLLEAYDGWEGYCSISKSDYDKISKFQ
jgi:nicotinamidase-related amidase